MLTDGVVVDGIAEGSDFGNEDLSRWGFLRGGSDWVEVEQEVGAKPRKHEVVGASSKELFLCPEKL